MEIRAPENKTHLAKVLKLCHCVAQITSDIHLFFLAFAHATFFSLVFGVVVRCIFGPLHYYVIFFLVQVVFVSVYFYLYLCLCTCTKGRHLAITENSQNVLK